MRGEGRRRLGGDLRVANPHFLPFAGATFSMWSPLKGPMPVRATPAEYAFYSGGPVWHQDSWVKQALLYFDGVALLVPRYLSEKPFRVRPDLATDLRDRGLLEILEPEVVLDKKATKELADSIMTIVASGALDGLAKQNTEFHHLSFSRLGHQADEQLATQVYDALVQRGLARPTEDRVSIPMHPLVRSLVLLLLAPLLRPKGRELGLELSPVTDQPEIQGAVTALLSLETMPSSASVFSTDARGAGIDVSAVPVPEILRFRKAHRDQLDEYGLNLRTFIRDLGRMAPHDRPIAIKSRPQRVERTARTLRVAARQRFGTITVAGLGFAGAAWMVAQGDVIGGALTAGGSAVAASYLSPGPVEADVFSYLFAARELA